MIASIYCHKLELFFVFFMFCAVAACPTNISQYRLSLLEVLVTWTPPSSENASVLGYRVFYETCTGSKQIITITGMNADNVTLSGLTQEEVYAVTVLSFGAEFILPSVNCETIVIVTGKPAFSI